MVRKGSKKYPVTLFIATSFGILLLLLVPVSQAVFFHTFASKSGFGQEKPKNVISVNEYDAMKNCTRDRSKEPTSIEYLTFFNCGRVSESQNGQTVREFNLLVKENKPVEIMDGGYMFKAWTFNGTIPGPTMRVTEGDLVKITVINDKSSKHPHSLHMHSIHPAQMDGVEGQGIVPPGKNFTYQFIARPYGVYPYHCHVSPVFDHINRGLYGMLIIDPKEPRPQMKELVMMMNGYDLNYDMEGPAFIPSKEEVNNGEIPEIEDRDNELYSVNGKAFDYVNHPVQLVAGEKYRIYLANMLEFDLVNSIHVHGTMLNYYPAGTSKQPEELTDIVTLGQGDRGILELSYPYPGRYMFHAHINEFADKGWMGFFNVIDSSNDTALHDSL